MRDPFVFVDSTKNKYYIPARGDNRNFVMYESKDLKKWKSLGNVFSAPDEFWGTDDFWAPDMFKYKSKYYILATFSAKGHKRGCTFLVSNNPEGPYHYLANKKITPEDWQTLDATLVIDNNEPYLLYCREWLETIDGEIYIQKLSDDLLSTVGEPKLLFKASSAPWVGDIKDDTGSITGKVTDAPFIYRVSPTELYMIWSSFSRATGKYSIGLARSENGSIFGPWKQENAPLNDDDGGHAMIFKDLKGNLKISYHAPNSYPNYVKILSLDIYKGVVKIIK